MHSMELSLGDMALVECQVTWDMWNLVLVRLETVLVSVHDRCTVCAKRTIGSEILLDAPDGTPR